MLEKANREIAAYAKHPKNEEGLCEEPGCVNKPPYPAARVMQSALDPIGTFHPEDRTCASQLEPCTPSEYFGKDEDGTKSAEQVLRELSFQLIDEIKELKKDKAILLEVLDKAEMSFEERAVMEMHLERLRVERTTSDPSGYTPHAKGPDGLCVQPECGIRCLDCDNTCTQCTCEDGQPKKKPAKKKKTAS